MHALGDGLGVGALNWLLGSLCDLYRQPFVPALVAQQFPPPLSLARFLEAAQTLGLKTGTVANLDLAQNAFYREFAQKTPLTTTTQNLLRYARQWRGT